MHTLGRLLFGDLPRSGSVTLGGQRLRPNNPGDAIAKGMGLLTENRKLDGLLLPLGVKENITLAALQKFATLTLINNRAEAEAAGDYVQKLAIKTPNLRQRIRYLSGGNQQKALIGRWMLQDLRVLILSEPTRGIDVGSKSEIYRLIDELAHQGMAVLVLSTEIPEVLGIADRVLVVREGQITAEYPRAEATQEKLIAAAAVAAPAQGGA
ncbi:MAG: sugar ABC transporter ATP-binding protein [Anaerolineae bacterium]|nr:sugar ABC transporter ATP-binding protein [Anaerolineae bacterium]